MFVGQFQRGNLQLIFDSLIMVGEPAAILRLKGTVRIFNACPFNISIYNRHSNLKCLPYKIGGVYIGRVYIQIFGIIIQIRQCVFVI